MKKEKIVTIINKLMDVRDWLSNTRLPKEFVNGADLHASNVISVIRNLTTEAETMAEKRRPTMNYPLRVIETLKPYIDEGIPPGDFVRALLTNNLVESFARADEDNLDLMFHYAMYLYNEMPEIAWRTDEKIDAWLVMHMERRQT